METLIVGRFFYFNLYEYYLVKGPLIELSLGGKKGGKEREVGEKEKVRNNCVCFTGE